MTQLLAPRRNVAKEKVAVGDEESSLAKIDMMYIRNARVVISSDVEGLFYSEFGKHLCQSILVFGGALAKGFGPDFAGVAIEDDGARSCQQGADFTHVLERAGGVTQMQVGENPDWLWQITTIHA